MPHFVAGDAPSPWNQPFQNWFAKTGPKSLELQVFSYETGPLPHPAPSSDPCTRLRRHNRGVASQTLKGSSRMNPGSGVNHPIRGSLRRRRSSNSTLKAGSGGQLTPGAGGGIRCETTTATTGGKPARVSMPEAAPTDCTAEHRKTMRDRLRILARIIARAHLRQQAERGSAPAPGPPPAGESRH